LVNVLFSLLSFDVIDQLVNVLFWVLSFDVIDQLVNVLFSLLSLYICCMIVREIWRFVRPRKIIFPEGNARGEYDFSWVNKASYLPNIHAINCLLYRINTRLHHRLTRDKA
jgi:hypothetical protein